MQINGLGWRASANSQQQRQNAASTVDRDVRAEAKPSLPSVTQAAQQAQRWQRLQISYDQPAGTARQALATYQAVATAERREQVGAMFGVDVYA
ncbi:hypothetical protein [Idiomarina xiamenensis]|uniref:Uncharacterized protein n=1 Tax=Idiomarina xiamenensis 10-D-4 TaxID=740709 RepID=K2KYN6_9GAMM|nr:hypothetical protein [Idiomarina xiamenensis]EKE82825.1 hypothetical protein A10D4_09479 [Idiomarina xiamenensis 10-D-4]